MSFLISTRNIGKQTGGGVVPISPSFNSGGTPTFTLTNTTHNITVPLVAGTNRRAILVGLFQNASGTFSSGTFDQDGAGSSAMTAVTSTPVVYATGTRIVLGAYHYEIPDGVTAGDKVFRLTTSVTVPIALLGYAWNDVGSGNPTAGTPLTVSGAQPTPVDVTADSAGDLVISVLGLDINQSFSGWAPSAAPMTLRNFFGTGAANNITLAVADGLATGAGTVNVGWTAGAGTPGETLDAIVHGFVFPRLS